MVVVSVVVVVVVVVVMVVVVVVVIVLVVIVLVINFKVSGLVIWSLFHYVYRKTSLLKLCNISAAD